MTELEHLKQERDFYKNMADQSYGWEYWADNDYNVLYSSYSCKRVTGYTSEEFKNHKSLIIDIIHPEDKDYFLTHKHSLDSEGNRTPIDFRIIHKNGTVVWINHACSIVHDSNDKPIGTRGSNRVITDEKLIEIELTKSEERFHDVFQNMSDGCVVYRYDKKQSDFTIINANQACEEIENITKEQMCGNFLCDVFPAVKDFGLFDILVQVYISGEAKRFPLSFYHDNRLSGWRDNFVYRLNNGDVVCVYADKTKEKESEFTLKKQNKELTRALGVIAENQKELKEINATKDRFFSIIAHDLRSPFTSILGYFDILQSKYHHLTDAERLKLLGGGLDTSKNIFNLLENLLQWAQSQSGIMEFNVELIDIQSMVQEVINTLQEFAHSKEITISSTIDIPIIITCDKEMIKTVLRNYISNAIKFTPRGGKVVVNKEESDTEITISVVDNGFGIRKEIVNKLFDISKKVSTLGTENEKGTGLGLFLCREFIEKHNGSINIESKEGEGSTFSFTIEK